MTEEVLIVFVKNPEIGKVKTRLAKSIGDANALAIYLLLLNHCFELTEAIKQDVVIYYNKFIDSEDQWSNSSYKKFLQKGDDLGSKMSNALSEQLNLGYKKACLVGSDIYDLDASIIYDSFEILDKKDIVIGPAVDGGYYLIGLKQPREDIFKISNWSTSSVFKDTTDIVSDLNLTFGVTEILNDIDTIDDLRKTDLIKKIS